MDVEVKGHSDGGAGLEGEIELGRLHNLAEAVDVLFESDRDAKLLLDSLCGVLKQPLAEVLTSELVVSCRKTLKMSPLLSSATKAPVQTKTADYRHYNHI